MSMQSTAAAMTDRGNNHPLPVTESAVMASPTSVQAASSEFWTTNEVAAYLRCEPQTIRKAISQKGSYHGLKPRRFGRRWYFNAAQARAVLESA